MRRHGPRVGVTAIRVDQGFALLARVDTFLASLRNTVAPPPVPLLAGADGGHLARELVGVGLGAEHVPGSAQTRVRRAPADRAVP